MPAGPTFFRVVFKFRQYDRRWTEVYGSNKADVPEIVGTIPAVVAAAIAFRHPAVYIQTVRISNPAAPRQGQPIHVANPGTPLAGTVPEATALAAIYEFAGTIAGVKRHVWIRGLKKADVVRVVATGQDQPSGALDGGVKSYFDALKANGYGIPNVVPVDTGDNRRHPIDSITVDANGRCHCDVSEAFVTPPEKRLILYRIDQKLFPGLKGRVTVVPDGTGFKVLGYLSHLPAGLYVLQFAAFRQEVFRFTAFQTSGATFLAFDRRDTAGGPLDTRGRSRALIRAFR